MIAPTGDAYGPTVCFGNPMRERAAVGALALTLLACGIALWIVWDVPMGLRAVSAGGIFVGAALLGVLCWRIDPVEIDVHERKLRRTHGYPPFASCEEVSLDSPFALRFSSTVSHSTVNGLPEECFDAWIVSTNLRVRFIRGWKEARAREYLSLLAERLNTTLEAVEHAEPPRARTAMSGVMVWSGVAAVFTIMFWPVLSGKRPLRPVWASPSRNRGMEISPQESLYSAGKQRYREGKFDEAERAFRDAAESGMDRGDAFNMIAYCQAGRKKYDDALATAKKALEYSPQNGNIVDTVGEMHELRGDYKLAVDYYEKALAMPSFPPPPTETRAKLGRTLLALGRRKEAVEKLKDAARFPNDTNGYGQKAIQWLRDLGEEVPEPLRKNVPALSSR